MAAFAPRSIAFLALALALSATPTHAAPSIAYDLGSEASMQAGCMQPCLCPVLVQSPLVGTFTLEPLEWDGGFQHYRVLGIDWQFKSGGAIVHAVGSGTYRVAGDQQELVVDLAVGGLPVERYDSGLTGGGSSFPALRLPIALHDFFCRDSVYGVQATPMVAGALETPFAATAPRLGPNPFHGSTEIAFALLTAGRVDLVVHDLAGRAVRTLASSTMSAGPHALVWDGRDASGQRVPAGVYFVRLRIAGRESRGAIVKLE